MLISRILPSMHDNNFLCVLRAMEREDSYLSCESIMRSFRDIAIIMYIYLYSRFVIIVRLFVNLRVRSIDQ